jgi:hypothetical protein
VSPSCIDWITLLEVLLGFLLSHPFTFESRLQPLTPFNASGAKGNFNVDPILNPSHHHHEVSFASSHIIAISIEIIYLQGTFKQDNQRSTSTQVCLLPHFGRCLIHHLSPTPFSPYFSSADPFGIHMPALQPSCGKFPTNHRM